MSNLKSGSLTPGSRIGSYEVLASIGAGGMGEVFRARDTKLGRDVAIKVLSAAFADDPERLARFTREAQALALLNHPNAASIYGVEEVPAAAVPGTDRQYDVSHDGRRFILNRTLVQEQVPIAVLVNWQERLRQDQRRTER